jgi:WD40 repeat protein
VKGAEAPLDYKRLMASISGKQNGGLDGIIE